MPALRRRFLNAALSQSDRAYYRQHAQYTKIVLQKNALLKSPAGVDRKLLATYNQQLAAVGVQIICARAAFAHKIAAEAAQVHANWVGARPTLELSYLSSPALPDGDESPGAVLRALENALGDMTAAEMARKTSLVGPHRDDMRFALGGEALARFGSQGQQRTAVLAAKAAEYALLAKAAGEPPLLLLDDVLSELDPARRRAFMSSIEDCEQAFVTSTDAPELPGQTAAGVFEIHAGQLTQSARL
ncbi:MAG TPA: DNA replication and repair protein RecF [Candidatus Eremiobacteraceae bacterium]|nr:DNA replication and repair protein RecF [Candidatus Eremiobacteraceae bacterium]